MPDVMDIHTGAEQNEPGPDGVVDGTFIGEHWGGFPPIINRVILYCQIEPGSNEVNRGDHDHRLGRRHHWVCRDRLFIFSEIDSLKPPIFL